MSKLDELRRNLTEDQHKVINAVWNYELEKDTQIPTSALYYRLGKDVAASALKSLNGSILREYSGNGTPRCGLTFLGGLLTDQGNEGEELLKKVLIHVQSSLRADPEFDEISSEKLKDAFGFTDAQIHTLWQYVHLSPFSGGGGGGGAGRWSYGVSYRMRNDLPLEDDLSSYLEKYAFEEYDPNLPVLYDDRNRYLSGKNEGSTRSEEREVTIAAKDTRNVFVVHGRNLEARSSLFRFLRSIGLRPLEWSQAVSATGKASPFIGEILDVAFSTAQAIVVLMTPDDEAWLREPFRGQSDPPYESQPTGQARPNVLFEAGMAMGRNPDRTIIVELGTIRPFSDIAGRHTVRLSNDSAARQELAQRLETAGCAVDLTGRDWHGEGDFNIQPIRSQKIASISVPQSAVAPLEGDVYTSLAARYNLNIIERDILLTLFKRIEALSANQIASELGAHVDVVEPAISSLRNKLMVRVIENTMGDDYKVTSIGIETARNILLSK